MLTFLGSLSSEFYIIYRRNLFLFSQSHFVAPVFFIFFVALLDVTFPHVFETCLPWSRLILFGSRMSKPSPFHQTVTQSEHAIRASTSHGSNLCIRLLRGRSLLMCNSTALAQRGYVLSIVVVSTIPFLPINEESSKFHCFLFATVLVLQPAWKFAL